MADNKTNKPLPKVEAAEDKLPMQQQFNFGQQAEDFRTDSEIQKDLLSKIFTTLLDISGNVTIISEMMPDLLSAQKSLEALRGPDRLAEQEKQQEDLARTLRGDTAKVVKDTADGAIGFFEKIFALITPFLLGFALSFVDLTNPIKLLKAALIGVVGFLTGKFIYQLGKSFVNTLLTRALDNFVGPKIINAPNSIINTGGVGTLGTDIPGTGGTGGTGGKGRTGRTGRTGRGGIPIPGGVLSSGKINPAQKAQYDLLRTQNVPAAKALEQARAFTTPTSTISKLSSGLTKKLPIIGTVLTLAAAPMIYSSKRDEGKTKARAGTETAASITGILAGGAAGAALGTAIGGPIGTVIGGIIGATAGEKVISSLTEGLFDFFTGKPENKNKISFYSESFKEATIEEKLKQNNIETVTKQILNDPIALRNLSQGKMSFSPLTKFTDQELVMAQNAIRKAKEQAPEKREATNFNIARGGDMHQQTIVNQRALEAEITKRGLGAK